MVHSNHFSKSTRSIPSMFDLLARALPMEETQRKIVHDEPFIKDALTAVP